MIERETEDETGTLLHYLLIATLIVLVVGASIGVVIGLLVKS